MENRKRIAVLMGPPALFLLFLFVLPLAIGSVRVFDDLPEELIREALFPGK